MGIGAIADSLAHVVWRADQMGSSSSRVISTGSAALDNELPNLGWPTSSLTELLVQQPGIGEISLLRPALIELAKRGRVALVQPPHMPQAAAWWSWGLDPDRLLMVHAEKTADALWSAEQILQNGSCAALLFWQHHARSESLRRLHLAAQSSETVFWMTRPLATAQDSSPAPLRLALLPAPGGVSVEIIKRRGPHRAEPIFVEIERSFSYKRNEQMGAPAAAIPQEKPVARPALRPVALPADH